MVISGRFTAQIVNLFTQKVETHATRPCMLAILNISDDECVMQCYAVEFVAPGPRGGGGCLPTGMPNEELELAGGEKIRVTLIDAGNPLVVLSGRDLGLTGTFALTQNSRYNFLTWSLLAVLLDASPHSPTRLGMLSDGCGCAQEKRAGMS